jgi:hypothetical protein
MIRRIVSIVMSIVMSIVIALGAAMKTQRLVWTTYVQTVIGKRIRSGRRSSGLIQYGASIALCRLR